MQRVTSRELLLSVTGSGSSSLRILHLCRDGRTRTGLQTGWSTSQSRLSWFSFPVLTQIVEDVLGSQVQYQLSPFKTQRSLRFCVVSCLHVQTSKYLWGKSSPSLGSSSTRSAGGTVERNSPGSQMAFLTFPNDVFLFSTVGGETIRFTNTGQIAVLLQKVHTQATDSFILARKC